MKIGTLTSDKENGYCLNFFKINKDSNGSYILEFKIGEDNDVANGDHNIKIHRFTTTCGNEAVAEKAITVILPTPIPTQTPTITSTPTSTPNPTRTPTSTPIKTATAKSTPTKTATPKSTPTQKSEDKSDTEFKLTDVAVNVENPTFTPEGMVAGATTTKKIPIQAFGLIVSGVGFLGYGGYSLYIRRKNEYNGIRD